MVLGVGLVVRQMVLSGAWGGALSTYICSANVTGLKWGERGLEWGEGLRVGSWTQGTWRVGVRVLSWNLPPPQTPHLTIS